MKIPHSFPLLTTQQLLLDAFQPQDIEVHPLVNERQVAATGLGIPNLIQGSMYRYISFYCAIDFTKKVV
jgi:hypothetical protein